MATVQRVLPWRRQPAPLDELAPVVAAYRNRHPKAPTQLIRDAYEVAATAHEGQFRKTGDAYIQHPIEVATILASLGLDDTTLAAALLRDAVEDTRVSVDDLAARFGPEVAAIVDGVTKLDRLKFATKASSRIARGATQPHSRIRGQPSGV